MEKPSGSTFTSECSRTIRKWRRFSTRLTNAQVRSRKPWPAICAYAANIENLEVLGGAVELIAQHASLRILREHYPIVGDNLLASIREVLGAAATEQVITAWAEAYGFLAEILIRREKQIYSTHERTRNGWIDFKPFRVVRTVPESEIITSFYLQPADGGGVPLFKPGRYITVRIPNNRRQTTMRNYSLPTHPAKISLALA
jgi:nitric oxide dioxygenase